MTRADWEAATPKCRRGEKANIPSLCGELMRYLAHRNVWRCPIHDDERSGEQAAREAGARGMWFDDEAA